MKRSVQHLSLFIAAVFLFGGVADICIQYFSGEEIRWRIPLVFLGLGVGIPLFIVPFYEPAQGDPPPEFNENDYSAELSDSVGFMSSLGGEPGTEDGAAHVDIDDVN